MTYRWQRARIVDAGDKARFVGREVWVTIQQPILSATADERGNVVGPAPIHLTHLLVEDGRRVAIHAQQLELLAEFAEDVGLIPVTVWLETEASDARTLQ